MKFQLGFDSKERRIICRFLDRPDEVFSSPQLREGEPVGPLIEKIADTLEASNMFKPELPRSIFIEGARKAFEKAGFTWSAS